jgi:ubiquitin carboxyl-terminal hydrolase 5/13
MILIAPFLKNKNVEQAVEWLFSNPEDNGDIEEAAQSSSNAAQSTDPGSENPKMRLYALIAHKGTSVNCGHYVAYILRGGKWYLFNDEKVVSIGDRLPDSIINHGPGAEGVSMGYIYLFERQD